MNGVKIQYFRNGKYEVAQLIINNVNDKNPKNGEGDTPLHEAAKSGNFEICRLILDEIEAKNPENKIGITPLHYAAQVGSLSICKLIISNRCIVDKNPQYYDYEAPAREDFGRSPYHEAAANGHFDICKFYSEILDNPNPKNECGTTPVRRNFLETKSFVLSNQIILQFTFSFILQPNLAT